MKDKKPKGPKNKKLHFFTLSHVLYWYMFNVNRAKGLFSQSHSNLI